MIKKIAFSIALLGSIVAQANVKIETHVSLSQKNHKRSLDFTAVIADHEIFTCTIDDDFFITGALLRVDEEGTVIEFSILDNAGNVVSKRILYCSWNTEATFKISTNPMDKEVESLDIAVVASRN